MAAGGTFSDAPALGFDQADTTVTATALLVALSGDHSVILSGLTTDPIGVSYQAGSISGFGTALEQISVLMLKGGVTRPFTAAGVIAQGAVFYKAASGKVSTTAVGRPIGVAIEAASGDASVFTGLCFDVETPADPHKIADPGDAGAIGVTKSGSCAMTTAAAETRTLAAPTFDGQIMILTADVDGGNNVVTVSAGINAAGNTVITMDDAGDCAVLVATRIAGALRWRLISSNGCTLS